MHDITASLSWARAALPDELTTRAPSRLRGHLRGDWMADRARAQSDTGEHVHSQPDSTWSNLVIHDFSKTANTIFAKLRRRYRLAKTYETLEGSVLI